MNRIGNRVAHFPSVDSTNSTAAAHSSDATNHGLVITADAQTAGRGQYQRTWQAPAGSGILMSVLLFPLDELRRASILTAWAAVSVCETILQATGQQATIKWPNDVLIHGKKVCGILCEGGAKHIVAGIGLNVNQSADDFEKMGLPDATSLAIVAGNAFDVPNLTSHLIQQLDAKYDRLIHGDIATLEGDWKERIGLIGQQVIVEKMDGRELAGRLREMAFDGVVVEFADGSIGTLPPEAIRHLRQHSQ